MELNHDARTFHMTEVRHDKNDAKEEKTGEIPANVLDVLSSLYYMRTQPLEVGKSFTIDVTLQQISAASEGRDHACFEVGRSFRTEPSPY